MRKHVQILGILNVVWGAIGLMGAIIVTTVPARQASSGSQPGTNPEPP